MNASSSFKIRQNEGNDTKRGSWWLESVSDLVGFSVKFSILVLVSKLRRISPLSLRMRLNQIHSSLFAKTFSLPSNFGDKKKMKKKRGENRTVFFASKVRDLLLTHSWINEETSLDTKSLEILDLFCFHDNEESFVQLLGFFFNLRETETTQATPTTDLFCVETIKHWNVGENTILWNSCMQCFLLHYSFCQLLSQLSHLKQSEHGNSCRNRKKTPKFALIYGFISLSLSWRRDCILPSFAYETLQVTSV